ncbi:sn-glycerol-3-phosphate-binding periplasmic protein UgpB [Paenibacillus solanacearum]|uniref:Sn-glycerol-3-phosphate-binding periplasmic protein UgpB n=1 Tax=Paenibacillus solanacearum TaxID=2048548 RepID=A0A916JS86_9BACL|nr:ABC transporter substrate-binding protein [Paenibacillus solanacearum]CAG7598265.1 sn-glycerol-3-phosphate-binding periplasmic protein UgpB [Paenibacillus solanacearum]
MVFSNARSIIVTVLIACLLLFTACGAPAAPSAGGNTPGGDTAPKSNKPIELSFYFPVAVGGPLTKIFDSLAEQFNKENKDGITVKPIYTGSNQDTLIKAQTAVMGGTPPDLMLVSSTDLFTLLDMDAIIPLNDLIAKDGGDAYIKDFYEGFLANAQTGGKTYSIPFQRSTIILYYNKDAFKEVGLDPNKPPQNYQELTEYAKKLTKPGRWGIEISSTEYIGWMFQALALQNGKNLMDQDGKKVFFNTPENVKALQFWIDLIKKEKVMPEGATNWATIPSDFMSGKTAMMYHTTGNLGAVKNGAKFEFGTAFLPAGKNFGTPVGGANLYIFKGIAKERQEASWKYIRWLTQPERLAQFSIDTGYVAPTRSSNETEIMKKYIASFPQAVTARDQLKYASASFSTHNSGEVGKIWNDNLQSAITGTATAAEALKKAQEAAEKVLAPFNK